MTSIFCSVCYKTYENFKCYSNHLCRCNNEDYSDDDVDNNDRNCADAIVNDALDSVNANHYNDNDVLNRMHDNNITNDNDVDDIFEYNADEDAIENDYNDYNEDYDDENFTSIENIAANVADRYDMFVLDIESDLEENSHYANDSEIDEDGSIEETVETNDINEILANSLFKLKQSATNDKPSLQSNMIAAIELLSLL